MRIRTFEPDDRASVIALWHAAGLVRPWNDPERDLDRKLADSPWGMLVGVIDPPEGAADASANADSSADAWASAGSDTSGDAVPIEPRERVIASAMVGYDGHRGSIFYLAVDPAWQGMGHGSALMTHAEELLLARGCPKLNASVRADNAQVLGFYADRGYRLEGADHAVTMALRLIEDGPQP